MGTGLVADRPVTVTASEGGYILSGPNAERMSQIFDTFGIRYTQLEGRERFEVSLQAFAACDMPHSPRVLKMKHELEKAARGTIREL